MPALSSKVRTELLQIVQTELGAVNAKAESIANQHWETAEQKVANELGYIGTLTRIEYLKNEIEGMQSELNILEGQIVERARSATRQDFEGLGITVSANHYGQIYNKPMVFGRQISTLWDVLVLQELNATVPFLQIYESMTQLGHVFKRELLLCGNYQEARALYQGFHSKVIAAIGEQLPGFLAEVQSLPALGTIKGEHA